jgi:hypothetical protein
MAQNISTAVMQRRVEPHDSLDFFPTPPWATRALCESLALSFDLKASNCWEPACGEGHMARPLAEYFELVYSSDVHDYGSGQVVDFLWPFSGPRFDWIITNPPFRLAEQFVDTALERAKTGVAILVRSAFLEGIARYHKLFGYRAPAVIMQFAERVPMVKGRVDEDASTATAYCWLVWLVHRTSNDTQFVWIPPCRDLLERPNDYAKPGAEPAALPLFDGEAA